MTQVGPGLTFLQVQEHPKPVRRQYRSCDQCRKGRRACDASSRGLNTLGHGSLYSFACSTCAKTRKRCTFNWALTASKKAPRASTTRRSNIGDRKLRDEGALNGSADGIFDEAFGDQFAEGRCRSTSSKPSFPPPWAESTPEEQIYAAIDIPTAISGESTLEQRISQMNSGSSDVLSTGQDFQSQHSDILTCSASASDLPDGMSNFEIHDPGTASDLSHSVGEEILNHGFRASNGHNSKLSSNERHSEPITESWLLPDPSPAGVHQRLAASTNKNFISAGLIRIYHDSLEHALSCWVTEATCPYNVDTLKLSSIDLQESRQNEWGANWSNRMGARVCYLDTTFDSLRPRPLSAWENKTASRALNLAVMAFASQWSHLKSPTDTENDQTAYSWPLAIDFDRMIRESFWHGARKALQDSADISSFRVIFAHMIFALAQRPMSVEERIEMEDRRRESLSSPESNSVACQKDLDLAELDDSTELEKIPSHFETALRHLSSWRRRLEAIRSIKAKRRTTDYCGGASPDNTTSQEIRGQNSFNILYWLGVMCDTTSAAISKRPLVISDADCAIIRLDPGVHARPDSAPYQRLGDPTNSRLGAISNTSSSEVWETYLLQIKEAQSLQSVIRWPCRYEDAAAYLCAAIPVKVLLFRKVACLQTLSYRRAIPEEIERSIEDALSIHRYWDLTYGQFISSCIADHENLPPRIQSWYVLLAGHWHLAGLLLADIIESMDNTSKTMLARQSYRQIASTVYTLRRSNAYAIAKLARASCPPHGTSFSHARDFHFAVNQGALLTEPWTEILMRSFMKAGSVLFGWLAESTNTSKNGSGNLRDQLQMCIQALRLLGRKSDLACVAAENLCSRLKSLEMINELDAVEGECELEAMGFNYDGQETALLDEGMLDFGDRPEYLNTISDLDISLLQAEGWVA